MRKWLFIFGLVMIVTPAYALDDGRTDQGPVIRPGMVLLRGVGNVIGMPAELSSTMIREVENHSRLWPVTYIPRLLTNFFIRLTSGVNDIFFMPWIVPFTDDLSPWTEPMGLPDYPWQAYE